MQEEQGNDALTRRIRLTLEGMDDVRIWRDVPYGRADGRSLDLYDPPTDRRSELSPAVIIVAGYAERSASGRSYKDLGWTTSMAQLIAACGMTAITYAAREPANDLRDLLRHLQTDAANWAVDPACVGLVAVSGNAPTALSALMRDADDIVACAAFAYGCFLDGPAVTDVVEASRAFGFANPTAGRVVTDLRQNVPLLIVRAGRDQFAAMNASADRFVRAALDNNLPITVVNFPDGSHAFDLFDGSHAAQDVTGQMIAFLQRHLLGLLTFSRPRT